MREALPTWLERMPGWSPVVVCCDDPRALEYVSGELMFADDGVGLALEQGAWFNKIEALRVGLSVIGSGLVPCGQVFTGKTVPQCAGSDDDMVAFFDADTIATAKTAKMLEQVGPDDVAISASGIRDDMGFLLASVRVLRRAFEQIPPGMFDGYGPEDCALRIACWTQVRKPFVRLHPCWVRRTHQDGLRNAFHPRNLRESTRANGRALGELAVRLVAPSDLAQCSADCLHGNRHRIPA